LAIRQSRSTDLSHAQERDESGLARVSSERTGGRSVDTGPAASTLPNPSARGEGGIDSPERGSSDKDVFLPSDSLRGQLQAIRRRLWILNATLESLPAKIELACRKGPEVVGGDRPKEPGHSPDVSDGERVAPKAGGAIGRRWARLKLAGLRSKADRAERRAAVAINDAYASFGTALESVRLAAIARVKADEACLDPDDPPTARTCD
jgi:hypothetical protein